VPRRFGRLLAGIACAALPLALGPRAEAKSADDCLPRLRAELNVSPSGVPLVTLNINGTAAHLMLDTGAEQTTLTETAARRLGLIADFDHAQTMRGVGGSLPAGQVKPELVTGGGRALPGISFAVVQVTLPKVDHEAVDGLLGADVLGAYDLDINLGHHLILLYDPPNCAVPTLPWRRAYSEVMGKLSSHRHLSFPITLDGQDLTAFIDTGAQISLVDEAASGRLGVTDAALDKDTPLPMQGVSTQVVTARQHKFARLGFGGDVVLAPRMGITPLRLDDADLLMGTDMLMRQRIWLSYAAHRIYVQRPN
jgi:predicted aspartyl protease